LRGNSLLAFGDWEERAGFVYFSLQDHSQFVKTQQAPSIQVVSNVVSAFLSLSLSQSSLGSHFLKQKYKYSKVNEDQMSLNASSSIL